MDADERFDALADEAISLLRANGPMRAFEIFSSLLKAHDHEDDPGLADDIEEVVENLTEYGVWWLSDDCLALSDHLVTGNRFTHRLTADERERGVLLVGVDLDAVHFLHDAEWTTADGGTVSLAFERGQPDVLAGPSGWLDRFTAGGLLALSWSGEALTVEPVDALADGAAVVDLIREVFEANVGGFGVLDLHSMIGLVAVHEKRPFAQSVAPLSELLAEADLVIEGDLVAEQGFDFDAYRVAHHEDYLSHLADRHGLDRAEAEALDRLTSVVHRLDPEGGGEVDAAAFDAAVAALREAARSERSVKRRSCQCASGSNRHSTSPEVRSSDSHVSIRADGADSHERLAANAGSGAGSSEPSDALACARARACGGRWLACRAARPVGR